MIENPVAFLSLIKTLEAAVGHKTKYALIEPFPCPTTENGRPAIIAIQHAGGIIARHVGLDDMTFIIAVTEQDPDKAGHIELRYGSSDVFVEISRQVCDYKDAVLATLCHEVSHKFLHTNGIRHGTLPLEQEYLTEVAAVYLGMGKIMLNGCECQSTYTKKEGNKTTTNTHTLKVGYISRQCFAFVYRLICEMRRLTPQQFLSGLSEPARQAVLLCEREYSHWFKPEYHTQKGVLELSDGLTEKIIDYQAYLAARDYTLRAASERIEHLAAHVRESHRKLVEARKAVAGSLKNEPNPHLRYLHWIETRESVDSLTAESRCHMDDLGAEWQQLEIIAGMLSSAAPDSIVECPIDGTKFRVPSGRKKLLVTCSACSYEFIAITASVPLQSAPKSARTRGRAGLLRSLKAVFGRR